MIRKKTKRTKDKYKGSDFDKEKKQTCNWQKEQGRYNTHTSITMTSVHR